VKSVAAAPEGKDGISYLMDCIRHGVKTPLTDRYQAEILAQTGTSSLAEALARLTSGKSSIRCRFFPRYLSRFLGR
jgi:hypothetical protein